MATAAWRGRDRGEWLDDGEDERRGVLDLVGGDVEMEEEEGDEERKLEER